MRNKYYIVNVPRIVNLPGSLSTMREGLLYDTGMYIIFLYSLNSAQWSKITELGYRCATTASFKVT